MERMNENENVVMHDVRVSGNEIGVTETETRSEMAT